MSCHGFQPWSEVIILFSCSAELSLNKSLITLGPGLAQIGKRTRSFKFHTCTYDEEGLYYPLSDDICTDQLSMNCTDYLCLCFCICKTGAFLMVWLAY